MPAQGLKSSLCAPCDVKNTDEFELRRFSGDAPYTKKSILGLANEIIHSAVACVRPYQAVLSAQQLDIICHKLLMSDSLDPRFAGHDATFVQTLLLRLHPSDYDLIERAARKQGFSVTEFIELAAYLSAKEVVIYATGKTFQTTSADHD